MSERKIQRALLSVYYKDGIAELAQALAARNVEILASGGTAKALAALGIDVIEVEAFTEAPEVLGGRVKTLHPKIHAGILADRRKADHMQELEKHGFAPIDMVVCNLYPFTDKLRDGADHATLVETIDIGGPTMVRAAAKNADGGVAIVCEPEDYASVAALIAKEGFVSEAERRRLAAVAFRHVADYDVAIANWAEGVVQENEELLPAALPTYVRHSQLRYGENPQQKAALYRDPTEPTGAAFGEQLAGKALSYNNYLDLHGAYVAAQNNGGRARCAIIKHTNPCGLAESETQIQAFSLALKGDPVSAFGSIIGFNNALEGPTAQALIDAKLFVECIAAPDFSEEAKETLAKKPNLRLVKMPKGTAQGTLHMHRIGGGMLVQRRDPGVASPEA